MPFGYPDLFVAPPLQPSSSWHNWVAPKQEAPEWADNEEKKKLFGIELAKGHPSPFIAACEVFDETGNALWVSINWINDPLVLASHDLYLKTVQADTTLLDKTQLAAKLLKFADERFTNGNPVVEADIRLKTYELYAKIQGYLKPDNANTNSFIHNEMIVRIVGPEKKQETAKTIDIEAIEADSVEPLPLKLSFVK